MQNSGCGNNYISYTIAKGQTLYAIARQFNTTVAEILAANPALDVQLYYAGDVICIPRGTTPPAPAPTPTPPAPGCSGTAYTIRRGDSFYLIAQRYGIPLADLLAANPGVDPARLQVGQVICVPQASPAPDRCSAGYSVHRVTTGQTFADILVLYNISYSALLGANANVNLSQLSSGQELCIAPAGSRGACATGKGPYALASGDTLSILASRFSTTVAAILMANPTLTPIDFTKGCGVICLPENANIPG